MTIDSSLAAAGGSPARQSSAEGEFTFTLTRSQFKAFDLETGDATHEQLAAFFAKSEVGAKDGPAIIPATFNACPAVCRNLGGERCGGGQNHRLDENVAAMTGLGIDFDHLSSERAAALLKYIKASGLEAHVWETFGHRPPDDARMRVLFPFLQSMSLRCKEQWSDWAWPELLKRLGLTKFIPDAKAKNPSRVYYLPRRPTEHDHRCSWSFTGPRVDWSRVLGPVPSSFVAAVALVPVVQIPSGERGPVSEDVLEAARAELGRIPPAVQDQGGRARTFHAAMLLGHDFDLTKKEAWPLLKDWNLKCTPPWREFGLKDSLEERWNSAQTESAKSDRLLASFIASGSVPHDAPKPRGWRRDAAFFREVLALNGTANSDSEESDEFAPAVSVSAEVERPVIRITTREDEVNAAAIQALGKHEGLFQRGARLVRIAKDRSPLAGVTRPANVPTIAGLPLAMLREHLAGMVSWEKHVQTSDKWVPAHPPDWAVSAVLARGEWPGVRHLEAVTEAPVLRPDGTVLSAPGYDAQTGLLYAPTGPVPELKDKPTQADAMASAKELLDVVCDFPFESDAHRSAWLSGVLTPLARFAFAGPAPMHVIDANIRGAGKSMLTDIISVIVAGRPMSKMAHTPDDTETRKRITSIAMSGESLVLIDNVGDALGTPALDAALTTVAWTDRVLGRNEQVNLPLFATWYATGNNIRIVGDTARRTLHIRLESPNENPEERAGFKHPNVVTWAQDQRGALLGHALTVLRAYCVAGRPDQRLKNWGSYEAWSALVRNAIVWSGQADPGETRAKLAAFIDTDSEMLQTLLDGWKRFDPLGKGLTCDAFLKRLRAESGEGLYEAVLQLCPSRPGEFPEAQRLGKALSRIRDRPCGGFALRGEPRGRGGTLTWTVREVIQTPAP